MLNIEEIHATIDELENGDTTFDACRKLASLYIVDKMYAERHCDASCTEVSEQLHDILPQYHLYKEVKRKYQMHELTKEAVVASMSDLCREIDEFLHTLYGSTDMEEERQQLKMLSENFSKIF